MNARARHPSLWRHSERGASLVIALIALLALTFAGLAMVRAVDTASLIAGNFAYRQATTSVADMAFEAALGQLDTVNVGTATTWDADQAPGGTLQCNYYAFYSGETDGTNGDYSNGISRRVQDSTGAWHPSNQVSKTNQVSSFPALGTGYSYQCAIERLCQDPGTATTPNSTITNGTTALTYCYSLKVTDNFSQKSNIGPLDSSDTTAKPFRSANQYAYRVTVRILGPRNTSTLVQSVVLKAHTF